MVSNSRAQDLADAVGGDVGEGVSRMELDAILFCGAAWKGSRQLERRSLFKTLSGLRRSESYSLPLVLAIAWPWKLGSTYVAFERV